MKQIFWGILVIAAASKLTTDLVDAASVVPELQVELKYATADNFTGRVLYDGLKTCMLQPEAAQMLRQAQISLIRARPDLRLHVYDCARPHAVQITMWNVVKGTKSQGYVADPYSTTGSIHNYGCAVDLTVATVNGTPLDMGTPFDHFGLEAQPRHEFELLQKGKLTAEQVANRLLLRESMIRAGFLPLEHEWWHFNCASPSETRRRYERIP